MTHTSRRTKAPQKSTIYAHAALSYATIIFGLQSATINRHPYDRAGDMLTIIGIILILLTSYEYIRFLYIKKSWRQKMDENISTLEYSPNFGVGKLPREGDVPLVIEFATNFIPAHLFYSEEHLQKFIDINPGALRCIRTDKSNNLTGYYILLALSKRGEVLIRDGAIDVGVAMPASLTVSDPRDTDALYIGMIQGMGLRGQAEITMALTSHLHQISIQNNRPLRIYARPGHSSSRKLMDKLGFTPMIVDGLKTSIEVTTVHPGQLSSEINKYKKIQNRAEQNKSVTHPGHN